MNDFVITIGTVNGSGSQSANNILVKTLFRMGLPVCGKNLFPSNIAGLPTWFSIRVSAEGHLSRRSPNDIVVAMNLSTLQQDLNSTRSGGVFIYNSDLKGIGLKFPDDIQTVGIPFNQLLKDVTDSIKLKKLLTNMVYVGLLARLLEVDRDTLNETIQDFFAEKKGIIEPNLNAINAGWNYVENELNNLQFPFKTQKIPNGNKGKILIDGNSAAAMGLVFGGCTFMSWYPITPSSSLAESFTNYCQLYRKDEKGKNKFAIVQAEDELAAITMVVGAGWAGARALTTTSGPGLSLMAEAAGLSYFAETPAVIWDVQRAGPSTGLPTRTMQSDLSAAYTLSHGDTKHVVLLPATPEECFEFGQICFDLAEQLQTLVVVLSDLDLGMNFWISDQFTPPQSTFQRGKILNAKDLEKLNTTFARYKDVDADGICYRTLPGTPHPHAAYFTRGTGHDESARYSEDHTNYRKLLTRLARKYETAKKYVPKPEVHIQPTAQFGVIFYGSSAPAVMECQKQFVKKSIPFSTLRIRALPLTTEVEEFVNKYETIYVVEQNRDGQLRDIICSDFPVHAKKLKSINQYDGLPLEADFVTRSLIEQGAQL